MSTITSTGVGSGLDVSQIVSSLMRLERRPLNLLEQQASTLQTRLSSFGTLQGQIAALGDVAKRLASTGTWNPLRVSSSQESALGATPGAQAVAGSHRIEIQQLAQAQTLASRSFAAGGATVVGTGTLTLSLGTTGSDGSFTPRDGSTPVTITVGEGQQTLAGIRNAINAARAGVTANIVTRADGSAQLVLRAADGTDGTLRLQVADADGDDTGTTGLSALAWDPPAAVNNLTPLQAAQDARFSIDGLAVTSSSNHASVLGGVTLQLKQVTTAPVELKIETDEAQVRKNVEDFVGAYNTLVKQFAKFTQADPGGTGRGVLQGDASTLALQNGLRESLRGAVAGLGGTASLNAAGIELQRDGTLRLQEERFKPLLAQPSRLAALFGQQQVGDDLHTRGFALRLSQWASRLTRDDGALATRVETLNSSLRQNQRRVDTTQAKLDRTEARLRAQYQRLDSQMSQLNGEMARLRASLGLG